MKKSGTFKFNLLVVASTFAFSSHASIVINEIDYDQPGTDNAEFIELFNSGTRTISLDNFSVDLINGSNLSTYRNIDLSGFSINSNSYFVMCSDPSAVANCNYSFTTSNSWFQNGAPDAVSLYENSILIDSLSYEGSLAPFTEGTAFTISDNNSETLSLARIKDGIDSNNNALDFQLSCITPGAANISGTGDCSTSVSAVPLPAAVWLFGSGLIGIVGFARRTKL